MRLRARALAGTGGVTDIADAGSPGVVGAIARVSVAAAAAAAANGGDLARAIVPAGTPRRGAAGLAGAGRRVRAALSSRRARSSSPLGARVPSLLLRAAGTGAAPTPLSMSFSPAPRGVAAPRAGGGAARTPLMPREFAAALAAALNGVPAAKRSAPAGRRGQRGGSGTGYPRWALASPPAPTTPPATQPAATPATPTERALATRAAAAAAAVATRAQARVLGAARLAVALLDGRLRRAVAARAFERMARAASEARAVRAAGEAADARGAAETATAEAAHAHAEAVGAVAAAAAAGARAVAAAAGAAAAAPAALVDAWSSPPPPPRTAAAPPAAGGLWTLSELADTTLDAPTPTDAAAAAAVAAGRAHGGPTAPAPPPTSGLSAKHAARPPPLGSAHGVDAAVGMTPRGDVGALEAALGGLGATASVDGGSADDLRSPQGQRSTRRRGSISSQRSAEGGSMASALSEVVRVPRGGGRGGGACARRGHGCGFFDAGGPAAACGARGANGRDVRSRCKHPVSRRPRPARHGRACVGGRQRPPCRGRRRVRWE